MSAHVLVSVRPGRTRAALVENGALIDLQVFDDGQQSLVGNIYLGRVEKVLGHLSAAFVDLGGGISGFLGAADARPAGEAGTPDISSCVTEGQAIIVQVQRDGFEDKGPKLTTRAVLGGRAMILTPGDPGVRVSRRIDDAAERARLENLARDLALLEEGFILRTAAIGLNKESFERDAAMLRQSWLEILALADRVTPPALLHDTSGALETVLRDLAPGDGAHIKIDDADTVTRARLWCQMWAPDLIDRIDLHSGAIALFDAVDASTSQGGEDSVEVAVDEALSPTLQLPSGGSVMFSQTPALVAMDVNAGGASSGGTGRTVLATNLEAVALIARQIRLRNLSGLLIVDFISTKNKKDQAKVLEALKKAVAGDPANVFVGGFTRFGLLEMTRRRSRAALSSILLAPCLPCDGQGWVLSGLSAAHKALDRLSQEADMAPAGNVSLAASPAIIQALQGPAAPALVALNNRFGRQFKVAVDDRLAVDAFEIVYNSKEF